MYQMADSLNARDRGTKALPVMQENHGFLQLKSGTRPRI